MAVKNDTPPLNPEQVVVTKHRQGPLRVGAVAGSGKTTALVERVVELVNAQVDPNRILMISFSRVARDEMQKRIDKRLPGRNAGKCARTFHSIGLDIYKREVDPKGFCAIDTSGRMYRRAIVESYEQLGLKPQTKIAKKFAGAVKNGLLGTSDALRRLGKTDPRMEALAVDLSKEGVGIGVPDVIKAFYIAEEIRSDRGVEWDGVLTQFVTFDDMIYQAAMLLKKMDMRDRWSRRWDYILQDECQDENEAQAAIAQALANSHSNYMVVGDPAQSIYGFRGAKPEHMLHFDETWPNATTLVMHRNYRSGLQIVEVANRVMDAMPANTVITDDLGTAEPMTSERATQSYVGYHLFETVEEEADAVTENILAHRDDGFEWKDQSILLRMNRMTRSVEMALAKKKIPYKLLSGQSFFAMLESKILFAYARVLANRASEDDIATALKLPPRGLGQAFADRVIKIGATDHGDWLPAALKASEQVRERQARAAEEWASLMLSLRPLANGDPGEVFTMVRNAVDLDDWLKRDVDDDEDSVALENLAEVTNYARSFETVDGMLDNVDEILAHRKANIRKRNVILVSTIHKAKGAEWKVVYLIGVVPGSFPFKYADVSEERRLFYVAVTRAMDELWISNTNTTLDSVLVVEAALKPEKTFRPGKAAEPNPVGSQMGLLL